MKELRTLLVAFVAFLMGILYLIASLLPPCHFFYLNYSLLGFSGGILFLLLRRYNLKQDIKPLIKTNLATITIWVLLFFLDCALFYAYFIEDKIKLFEKIENIKEYYGLYLLIDTIWIVIIFFLKNKRQ